jgi:hypothetical protein
MAFRGIVPASVMTQVDKALSPEAGRYRLPLSNPR